MFALPLLWPSHNRTMACPLCGESCTCSYADRAPDAAASSAAGSHVAVLIDPEHFQDSEQQFLASLDAPPESTRLPDSQADFYRSDSVWREEVASRVDAYRTRRGRRRPDPSALLSFDFDRAQPDLSAVVAAGATWQAPSAVIELPPPAIAEPKVIEFPRSAEVIAEELAGILGLPLGTVKSRVNRARIQLAKVLKESRGGHS